LAGIFSELEPALERLAAIVSAVIEGILEDEGIDIVQIQDRVKSLESFFEKIARKNYAEPTEEITDLVGIRVIVMTEQHVVDVDTMLRQVFEIDEQNCVDNTSSDDPRAFGYRSLHLVCSLGNERDKFREYKGLGSQKFEIQIRTTLQHAWAEIEHKLNYKSERALPAQLQRRLFLAAANLEDVDRELAEIHQAAESYALEIGKKGLDNDETPLNAISFRVVVDEYLEKLGVGDIPTNTDQSQTVEFALKQLEDFGVATVADFKQLVVKLNDPAFRTAMQTHRKGNLLGIARLMMFATDFKRAKHDVMPSGFSLGKHTLELIKSTSDIKDPEAMAILDLQKN